MLPLVQSLKTVPAYILSHGFANTQLLVAVDQLSRRCFCRPPRPYAEWGGLAELTEQWFSTLSPCLPHMEHLF